MDLNKGNMKKIRGLILFTAVVCLAVVKMDVLLKGAFFLLGIVRPFIYGAAIAFVLNIPMKVIEKGLFSRVKNRKLDKVKRPASIFLSFMLVILIVVIVTVTVIPQITKTMIELGNKIPQFLVEAQIWLEEMFVSQPQLIALLEEFEPAEMNWDSIVNTVIDFMQNGLGSVVSSTVTVASTIIGGVVNVFVALVFSFYILAQKEKLGDQFRRILRAYCPQKVNNRVLEIASLAGKNFSSFITGQCMEAVILGVMFVITMTLFGFPYAVMVGVLIAFTALIPIVGAFIGCFVGGSLMGVVGMLIFIPILSTVYALIREDVNEKNKGKKG